MHVLYTLLELNNPFQTALAPLGTGLTQVVVATVSGGQLGCTQKLISMIVLLLLMLMQHLADGTV